MNYRGNIMSLTDRVIGKAYITANKAFDKNPSLPVITGKITLDDGEEYWINFWPSRKGTPNVFSGNVLLPPEGERLEDRK